MRKSNACVGLDVGSRAIKVAEFQYDSGEPELIRAHIERVDIPGEKAPQEELALAVAQKLSEIAESFAFSKKRVVTGISGRAVTVKRVLLDKAEGNDLREAVRLEAAQQIPYDINEVVFDCQMLSTDPTGKQMEVLFVATKHESVTEHLSLLATAGIHPQVMDVDSFALQNVLEANYEIEPQEVLILAHVGGQSATVNIVQDHVPYFVTHVDSGGDNLLRAMQMEHGIQHDDALKMLAGDEQCPKPVKNSIAKVFQDLSTGIDRALAFVKGSGEKGRVTRIFLSGGCAGWKELSLHLTERNRLPVEVLNPFRRVKCSPQASSKGDLGRVAPQLAVAVGFALRKDSEK